MTSVAAASRTARAATRTSGSLRSLFLGGGGGGISRSRRGEGGPVLFPFSTSASPSASFDGAHVRLDTASSAGGDVASLPRGDVRRRGHASWEGGSDQPSPHTPPAAWWCWRGGGGGGGHPSRKRSPPPSPFFSYWAARRSSSSTSCAPTPRVVRGLLPQPRSSSFVGFDSSEWCVRSMSSGATPPPAEDRGGSRFRGDGGRGMGGRRGGGGGRGRGRGGGGGIGNSKLINSKILKATRSQDILSIVKDNLSEVNNVNVATAIHRLGKKAKEPDFSPRRSLATDETFQELLRMTHDFARNGPLSKPQEVSSITLGIAKLHEAGRLGGLGGSVDDALVALEMDVARVAPEMEPQAVSNTMLGFAKLERIAKEETRAALERAAVRVAPEMVPQAVSNTMWSYATLGRMPGKGTWGALERAAGRLAPEMYPQEVANIMWSYATLGRMPGKETWVLLERAAARVAPEMNSQAVANTAWAYATLSRMPLEKTWGALERAAARVAPEMTQQAVSNVIWSAATLGRMPLEKTWGALERAAARVAPEMTPQAVSNVIWSAATLGRMPLEKTWGALERAAARVAPEMTPQAVSNTILAYAMLGRIPGEEMWGVLERATVRSTPRMTSQGIANTVWAFPTLATLRGVELPSCYAALWDRACGMDADAFNDEELCQLFHAHLMLETFDSTRPSVKVAHPAWLTIKARDAWMRSVRDDTTVSVSHRQLARVIGELGVKHEVERVTNDGYFSMDIHLPEHDVCVEYDGRYHYYKIDDKHSCSPSRDASMTRTAKTELRDLFLAKECAKLVTVPWFEWARLNSPEKRRVYVKNKLADAGVVV